MATEPIDEVTGLPDTEPGGLASATAQQQAAFGWVADVASAAMPEFGSMTASGRHYPTIAQRKPGSTKALLRRARDLQAIYLNRRLDPAFREEIMLAVAGANACRQCSFAHRQWALAEGLSEPELAALEGLDPESFDGRTWAAIAWAQAYARGDFAEVPDAIDANFRQHFSAQEQADIELVVRTMFWMNETSNGVRAGVKRAKRDSGAGKHPAPRAPGDGALRRRGSRSSSLCCASSSDATRSRCFSDIKPFFREFDRRGPNTISGPGEEFAG